MLECRYTTDLDMGDTLALVGSLAAYEKLCSFFAGHILGVEAIELQRDPNGPAPYQGFLEGLRVEREDGAAVAIERRGLELFVRGSDEALGEFAGFLGGWLDDLRAAGSLDQTGFRSLRSTSLELTDGQSFVDSESEMLTLRLRAEH